MWEEIVKDDMKRKNLMLEDVQNGGKMGVAADWMTLIIWMIARS